MLRPKRIDRSLYLFQIMIGLRSAISGKWGQTGAWVSICRQMHLGETTFGEQCCLYAEEEPYPPIHRAHIRRPALTLRKAINSF